MPQQHTAGSTVARVCMKTLAPISLNTLFTIFIFILLILFLWQQRMMESTVRWGIHIYIQSKARLRNSRSRGACDQAHRAVASQRLRRFAMPLTTWLIFNKQRPDAWSVPRSCASRSRESSAAAPSFSNSPRCYIHDEPRVHRKLAEIHAPAVAMTRIMNSINCRLPRRPTMSHESSHGRASSQSARLSLVSAKWSVILYVHAKLR